MIQELGLEIGVIKRINLGLLNSTLPHYCCYMHERQHVVAGSEEMYIKENGMERGGW